MHVTFRRRNEIVSNALTHNRRLHVRTWTTNCENRVSAGACCAEILFRKAETAVTLEPMRDVAAVSHP